MKTLKATLAALATLMLTGCAQQGQQAQTTPDVPQVTLNNGVQMPQLGFGTLTLTDDIGTQSIARAIAAGYRLFDTAPIYDSEDELGQAIRESGIDRKEFFITSKVWPADSAGYMSTLKAFNATLGNIGTDYLDLYLIHRPQGDIRGTWLAMEELYCKGKIRAIGVSNFNAEQLDALIDYATVKPTVNQIEMHPFFQQVAEQTATEQRNMQVQAWSPLAGGRNDIMINPTLRNIGKKYNKTAAQVALRWLMQRGAVAIPRTTDPDFIAENISIFDFELDEIDMMQIASLDQKSTAFPEFRY